MGFVVVSPFAVDQLRSIERQRALDIETLHDKAQQAAATGAQQIGAVSNDARTLLLAATRMPDEVMLSPGLCSSELQSLFRSIDWVKSLAVASMDGVIYCASNARAIGQSIVDRSYFARAAASPSFVLSDVIASRTDSKPIVVGALASLGREGRAKYVMLVVLDMEKVASLIASQSNDQSDFILLDQAGNAVARYPRRSPDEDAGERLPVLDKIRGLTLARFDDVDAKGRPRAYAVHYLAATPARLLVGVSLEAPLQAAKDAAKRAYAHTAALTILMVFIGWGAGELQMIRPMRALTSAARAIGHGDLTARVNVRYASNQFKDLAAGFNFMAEQVQRLAGTDTLTTVANRREFDLRLADEWERARRAGTTVSLALIDVDRFKTLNDTLGHLAGDAALVEIGQVLLEHARRPSDLAARYGGDEFALLMAGLSPAEAARHCETLRSAVEKIGFMRKTTGMGLSVSVGVVSCVPQPKETATEFVSQADNALYAAKAAGRNRVVARELSRTVPTTRQVI